MKKTLLSLIAIALTASAMSTSALAHTPKKPRCPDGTFICPPEDSTTMTTETGEPTTYEEFMESMEATEPPSNTISTQ